METIEKIYDDPQYFNKKQKVRRETTEIEADEKSFRLLQEDKKEGKDAKDPDLKSPAEPPAKLPK